MFISIVEKGSISRAGEANNVAKSAVSRRLALLETRFGVKLIERGPGLWRLSPSGMELYQRALRAVGEFDEIEEDFLDRSGLLSGPLTISVPREFGLEFLKNGLITFQKRHPQIRLIIDFDDRRVDLERESFDLVIRIAPDIAPSENVIELGTIKHRFYASRDYLRKNPEPGSLAELAAHRLLNFGRSRRATWDMIAPNGKMDSVEFQPALNSNSGVFLLEATKAGLGIARLPDFIVDPAETKANLVEILKGYKVPDWCVAAMCSGNRRLNKRTRTFIDEMQELVASPSI
ncbi:LysR family transcriptional regulator [Sulfitobacter sp. TSTF-M16]|uniref:LysR family transcriptional regulator n=2 Tax=Sulfitobacter aestuariivivens TaxID=2766981 RepID=A0A927D383_9RHOB|nr:LysR family transcriptional regulator [Sulfitobacter aestuariivivens]